MRRRAKIWLAVGAVALVLVPAVAASASQRGHGHRRHPVAGGSALPSGSPTGSPTASPTPSTGPTSPAPSPAPSAPGTTPGGFTHPGVLVSRSQLDFVRAKVNAGVQPW